MRSTAVSTFVDVLATSTARPSRADVEVAGVDLHFNGISLWHHGNRGRLKCERALGILLMAPVAPDGLQLQISVR